MTLLLESWTVRAVDIQPSSGPSDDSNGTGRYHDFSVASEKAHARSLGPLLMQQTWLASVKYPVDDGIGGAVHDVVLAKGTAGRCGGACDCGPPVLDDALTTLGLPSRPRPEASNASSTLLYLRVLLGLVGQCCWPQSSKHPGS